METMEKKKRYLLSPPTLRQFLRPSNIKHYIERYTEYLFHSMKGEEPMYAPAKIYAHGDFELREYPEAAHEFLVSEKEIIESGLFSEIPEYTGENLPVIDAFYSKYWGREIKTIEKNAPMFWQISCKITYQFHPEIDNTVSLSPNKIQNVLSKLEADILEELYSEVKKVEPVSA